ncbi:hypothetical protein HAX54_022057, partial [Datura stramonium]|nr:hypothetical protein [Datura stramonium]
PHCSGNLTTAAVSPQWEFSRCSGTVLGSNSTTLDERCAWKGQEERKTNSKDDNNGPGSDEAGLEAMQELLGGLP